MSQPESQKQRPFHQSFSFDDFTLDLSRACLLCAGQEKRLRPKSFETLKYLIANNNRLISKEELMKAVWPDTFVTDDSLVQCLRDIRRALGDEQQRYIKTVARRGYIFDAEVIEHSSETPSAVFTEQVGGVRVVIEEIGEQSDHQERTRAIPSTGFSASPFGRWRMSRKSLVFSIPLLGLVIALSYFWVSSSAKRTETKPQVRTIAVLPFKPLAADGGDEYLGLGMADTLITKLSNLRQVTVRPTSAVRKYISPGQDPLAAGREQRVDAVLEGSLQRSGDKVRVTVRLIDVRDGSPLWAYKCDEYCEDIFATQDAIAEKVAGALVLELTGEERRGLAKRYTENAEAYQLYIQGVFFRNQMTEEGLKKSIDYFQKAIELDPKYALAYAGQASSNSPRAYFGHIPLREAEFKNRPLIMKALELDDTLAEAHAALAELKLFIEWDWEGAEKEFKRAIELNPSGHLAHHLYGSLLMAMGRFEAAIAKMKQALDIDPLSPRTGFILGRDYYMAGQYDQAIEQYNKMREIFPGHALIELGPVYERKGMYDQAVKEYLEAYSRSGLSAGEIAALRQVYVASGWRGFWSKRLELAKAEAERKPVQASFLAELYARLGEKDQAIEWLERAYRERNMSLIFLKVDPIWESLRPDPRFQGLLRRMRLAP
ncbi:MAG TPA: winged helix-turn-helix domain-containing protein [Blastocatellia bacterium]|nr:winged helix-turn-helix domain-containing protein [Blastocatellia bacterium]